MDIQTSGLHHLALRVMDLGVSRHFYGTTLGFPVILEGPGLFLFLAGRTAVGVRAADGQTPLGDAFDPHRVGLDHLAIACDSAAELVRVTSGLARAGVPNTGVKVDPTLNRQYVAFKDPDGIAWEYYMAPDATRAAVVAYYDALPTERRTQVQQVIVDGEHAAVQYTLDIDGRRTTAVDVLRVVNGEVVHAQPFIGGCP